MNFQRVIAPGFSKNKKEFVLSEGQKKNLMSFDKYKKFTISALNKLNKTYGNVIYVILNSEEFLSEIIYSVMYADTTFDSEKSSLTTYRINHIKWSVCDLISRMEVRKNMNKKVANELIKNYIKNESRDYISEYEEEEEKQFQLNKIKSCLSSLEDNERRFIQKHFFDGMSIKEISQQENISTQTIYHIIKQSKNKIKRMVGA